MMHIYYLMLKHALSEIDVKIIFNREEIVFSIMKVIQLISNWYIFALF